MLNVTQSQQEVPPDGHSPQSDQPMRDEVTPTEANTSTRQSQATDLLETRQELQNEKLPGSATTRSGHAHQASREQPKGPRLTTSSIRASRKPGRFRGVGCFIPSNAVLLTAENRRSAYVNAGPDPPSSQPAAGSIEATASTDAETENQVPEVSGVHQIEQISAGPSRQIGATTPRTFSPISSSPPRITPVRFSEIEEATAAQRARAPEADFDMSVAAACAENVLSDYQLAVQSMPSTCKY